MDASIFDSNSERVNMSMMKAQFKVAQDIPPTDCPKHLEAASSSEAHDQESNTAKPPSNSDFDSRKANLLTKNTQSQLICNSRGQMIPPIDYPKG
jgi:hypothetical protein